MADVLRGKTVPAKIVEKALARDGVLGPASCGWHYVEGLSESDEPMLAVVWDKVSGLGHNGDSQPSVAHEIVHLDGSTRLILKRDWPDFVVEQKRRIAEAYRKRKPGDPPIRWSDEATLGPNLKPAQLAEPIQSQTNSLSTERTP